MKNFSWLYDRACELKGEENLAALMPQVLTAQELMAADSAFYLSLISRRIFRAGLKHSVVDSKWPNFEKTFEGFNLKYIAYLSDEELEAHMKQPGLIKHWGKMKALRHNALWLLHLEAEEDGFGTYIANWPVTDIVGLWFDMKKQGRQLGGRSASAALRMAGKDTFNLSPDVLVQLRAMGVIDKVEGVTAKRDFLAIQAVFNQWHEASKLPMSHISRMLSFT